MYSPNPSPQRPKRVPDTPAYNRSCEISRYTSAVLDNHALLQLIWDKLADNIPLSPIYFELFTSYITNRACFTTEKVTDIFKQQIEGFFCRSWMEVLNFIEIDYTIPKVTLISELRTCLLSFLATHLEKDGSVKSNIDPNWDQNIKSEYWNYFRLIFTNLHDLLKNIKKDCLNIEFLQGKINEYFSDQFYENLASNGSIADQKTRIDQLLDQINEALSGLVEDFDGERRQVTHQAQNTSAIKQHPPIITALQNIVFSVDEIEPLIKQLLQFQKQQRQPSEEIEEQQQHDARRLLLICCMAFSSDNPPEKHIKNREALGSFFLVVRGESIIDHVLWPLLLHYHYELKKINHKTIPPTQLKTKIRFVEQLINQLKAGCKISDTLEEARSFLQDPRTVFFFAGGMTSRGIKLFDQYKIIMDKSFFVLAKTICPIHASIYPDYLQYALHQIYVEICKLEKTLDQRWLINRQILENQLVRKQERLKTFLLTKVRGKGTVEAEMGDKFLNPEGSYSHSNSTTFWSDEPAARPDCFPQPDTQNY